MWTYTITTTRETYDVEAVDRHHARYIAERRGGTSHPLPLSPAQGSHAMQVHETPTEYGYDVSVCVDCTYVLANGELPGDSETTLAEHVAAMNEREPDATDITLNAPEGDEEPFFFSWSSCDGCGSTLGGDRHPAVVWYAVDSPVSDD